MLFFSDCQPVNLTLCLVPSADGSGEGRAPPRPQRKRGLGLTCLVVAASSLLQLSPHRSRADAEGFVSNQRLLTPGQ